MVAEGVGFEPTHGNEPPISFQGYPLGPLGYPSIIKKSNNNLSFDKADDRTWTCNLDITSVLRYQLRHIGTMYTETVRQILTYFTTYAAEDDTPQT